MPLLLCDRDGVINLDSEHYIKSPAEFLPIPASLEAVARFSQAGWKVALVTNQSGLARGLFSLAALHAIHTKLHQLLHGLGGRVDAIFFCPHGPDASCNCRKPAPGLMQEALGRFGVRANEALVVGDSLRDLEAAARAKIAPHLVRTGNGLETEQSALAGSKPLPAGTQVHNDLMAVADAVLGRVGRH